MSKRETLIEAMAEAICDAMNMNRVGRLELDAGAAALSALEAAGVRLVPVEATEEMVERGDGRMRAWIPMPTYKGEYSQVLQDAYRAMLAASPYAPEGTRND